jgi:hypothetical protein
MTVPEAPVTASNMVPTGFFVGVDVGQANEYTAVVVNERHAGWRLDGVGEVVHHHLTFLHRFQIGMSYPQIVASVKRLLGQLEARRDPPELVVDATGVGKPVLDAMRAAGLNPMAVTITGGSDAIKRASNDWRVPKRDLASVMQMTLQSGRLKVAEAMELTPLLRTELESFKVKVNVVADDGFEAWREQKHDDLVLGAAVSVWAAEERRRNTYDSSMLWV